MSDDNKKEMGRRGFAKKIGEIALDATGGAILGGAVAGGGGAVLALLNAVAQNPEKQPPEALRGKKLEEITLATLLEANGIKAPAEEIAALPVSALIDLMQNHGWVDKKRYRASAGQGDPDSVKKEMSTEYLAFAAGGTLAGAVGTPLFLGDSHEAKETLKKTQKGNAANEGREGGRTS